MCFQVCDFHDRFDYLAHVYSGLVHDIPDIDCWVKNVSALGCVWATLSDFKT